MLKKIVKDKNIKVIIFEVFLIILGLVGLSLAIQFLMNGIGVKVDTSKLAISDMNAIVTSGTLTPVEDASINSSTSSNVLRITFDVKGANTNTNTNIIYDLVLNNIVADCELKNNLVKWNLYKNNNLLTTGNLSPSFDKSILNNKLTLTTTQENLPSYSSTADSYVFILWLSESCTGDITSCNLNNALSTNAIGKTITGNIDVILNTGSKKNNPRETSTSNACNVLRGNAAAAIANATNKEGSGIYSVSHEAIPAASSATGAEIPATTDYRYYGANPNNYVCLDMEGKDTCPDKHLYRAIGVVYDELNKTNMVKVIKATNLTDETTSIFAWDSTYVNIWATPTSGNYSNSTTSGATLMKLLNTGEWWNNTTNFANKGLSIKAKNFISTTRWYLGGYSTSNVSAANGYLVERGTARYDSNRPLYWEGKVGLMYPSDYGYAAGSSCLSVNLHDYDGGCKNSDWIHNSTAQWTLSPVHSSGAGTVNSTGTCSVANFVSYTYMVHPVLNLSSNAVYSEGEGTASSPYLLIS